LEFVRDREMVRTGVRKRLRPAGHHECECAASRAEATRSGEILRKSPVLMRSLLKHASGVSAPQTILQAAAPRKYRCARCPPLRSPAADAMRKPGPSALPGLYDATYRAKREQSQNCRARRPLASQR